MEEALRDKRNGGMDWRKLAATILGLLAVPGGCQFAGWRVVQTRADTETAEIFDGLGHKYVSCLEEIARRSACEEE